MKVKQIFSILLVLCMLTTLLPVTAEEAESMKTDKVFAVSTPEELIQAASAISNSDNPYSHIILLNDIDMAGYDWKPIASQTVDSVYPFYQPSYEYSFNGTFDGNGKTIKNLTIGSPDNPNQSDRYIGLFGKFKGKLKNLKLESVHIYSSYSNVLDPKEKSYVGGLAGYNSGQIYNCSVSGTIHVSDTEKSHAGLISAVNDGNITSCEAKGAIQVGSQSFAGGIISHNYRSITGWSSQVEIVAGESSVIGGICAENYGYQDYQGTNYIGVSGCFTESTVKAGVNSIAGFYIGKHENVVPTDDDQWFWNSDSTITISGSEQETNIPIGNLPKVHALPMTTSEMKSQRFADLLNEGLDPEDFIVSQWDFKDNQHYPKIYNIEKAENSWFGYIKKPEIKNQNTYLIRDGSELAWYAFCSNYGFLDLERKNIILQNDIDLGGKFWTPFQFNGNFNAQGYQIKNMTTGTEDFYDHSSYLFGLFSLLGNEAVIRNLGLTDISIFCRIYPQTHISSYPAGHSYVLDHASIGGLAASSRGGKILNCYVTGSITLDDPTGQASAGLLAADFESAAAYNCYASGTVAGAKYEGALFGQSMHDSSIKKCYWNKDFSSLQGIGRPVSTENGLSSDEMKNPSFVDILNQNVNDSNEINLMNWVLKDDLNHGLPVIDAERETFSPAPIETASSEPSPVPSDIPAIVNHAPYIIGYPEGFFYPDANITRAETVSLFSKLYGAAAAGNNQIFSDVPENAWYFQAVQQMCAQGLISGYEDGTFRPQFPVTRAEFAVLVTKFLEQTPVASTNYPFSDISAHWAAPYINSASQSGFISGYEDGTFQPDHSITRAEAAAMLNRVLGRIPEPSKIDKAFADNPATLFYDVPVSHWAYYHIIEATYSHPVDLFHSNK